MRDSDDESMGFWGRIRQFLFPHTVYLEGELARTRLELSRWQNALLESKNLPPVAPYEPKPLPTMRGKLLPSQWRTKVEAATRKKQPEDSDHAA